MSAQTEPTSITAGDSLSWVVSLADYPATAGWALKYRAINQDSAFELSAVASGSDHAIELAATVTATWPAGRYTVTRYVVRGVERVTLSNYDLTVLPDLAVAHMHDGRSQAQQILDALEAAYLEYATSGKGHWGEYEVAGRKIQYRNSADLLRSIDYYRGVVARERLRAGGPRRVLVRF